MAPKRQHVTIDLSIPDVVYVYIGNVGHPISIHRFREMMLGSADVEPEHIIRNVAIRGALSGVDPETLSGLDEAVNNAEFYL